MKDKIIIGTIFILLLFQLSLFYLIIGLEKEDSFSNSDPEPIIYLSFPNNENIQPMEENNKANENDYDGNGDDGANERDDESEIEIEEENIGERVIGEFEETLPLSFNFIVTRIIDGDTFELNSGDRVRLICIDTPERGESGFKEAKDYLEDLLLDEEVILEKDVSETDRYNRLLRYVYLGNGDFVNELIVRNGYGKAYRYGKDVLLCDDLEEAEEKARDEGLRIWEFEQVEDSDPIDVGCDVNYYNCSDFNSCSEVMEVFDSCNSDIHRLDGDDDGVPCDSLCG